MRKIIVHLILLLAFLLGAAPASALGEVVPAIRYDAESGTAYIACEGLYPGNEYALAVLETDNGEWSAGNLLFLDQLTASAEGTLEAAFIHTQLSGVVLLGGETESAESPLRLGMIGTALESDALTLPTFLKTIGDEAFMDDTFSYVYLGNEVETIGVAAFKNCVNLREIHIPASVTKICAEAFDGCPNVVIVCTQNSAAHTYARDNGLAFRLE